jgi:hypothetical protein
VRDRRRLTDLVSVGNATLRDFDRLGVSTVAELSGCDPEELYFRISAFDGTRHDPCVLDVFRAAVAQARCPDLPQELCRWWTWSQLRRNEGVATPRPRRGHSDDGMRTRPSRSSRTQKST